jgi:hypothetical protein
VTENDENDRDLPLVDGVLANEGVVDQSRHPADESLGGEEDELVGELPGDAEREQGQGSMAHEVEELAELDFTKDTEGQG